MQTFWMVVGSGVPYFRHAIEASARKEASRLAMEHPGEEFTVLKSIATAKKTDIQWSLHHEQDPEYSLEYNAAIPF